MLPYPGCQRLYKVYNSTARHAFLLTWSSSQAQMRSVSKRSRPPACRQVASSGWLRCTQQHHRCGVDDLSPRAPRQGQANRRKTGAQLLSTACQLLLCGWKYNSNSKAGAAPAHPTADRGKAWGSACATSRGQVAWHLSILSAGKGGGNGSRLRRWRQRGIGILHKHGAGVCLPRVCAVQHLQRGLECLHRWRSHCELP